MTTNDLVRRTGLTQEEISVVVGMSPSAVSQCLTGKAVSKRITDAIDQLANVKPGTTLSLCQEKARARRESMLRRLAAKGIALVPDPDPEPEEAPINKD